MRVVVANAQVPFVRGGAELLAEQLVQAVRRAGHEADLVQLPFQWDPPERLLDQMQAWQSVGLDSPSGPPDRVVCLKFPTYLLDGPKVAWLLHQHRPAYDLWGHPFGNLHPRPEGLQVQLAVRAADRRALAGIPRWTISRNVSRRLQESLGLDARPLYHPPPLAPRLRRDGDQGRYILFPSRLNAAKRQGLVLEALRACKEPVQVWFAGRADDPREGLRLKEQAKALRVDGRVRWLGAVDDEDLVRLYADCLAVVYPPYDEDYGYVTLEALASAKPVITCTDSGGPLEFVEDGREGVVARPEAAALAAALDRVWSDAGLAKELGRAGGARYDGLELDWAHVVRALLA